MLLEEEAAAAAEGDGGDGVDAAEFGDGEEGGVRDGPRRPTFRAAAPSPISPERPRDDDRYRCAATHTDL